MSHEFIFQIWRRYHEKLDFSETIYSLLPIPVSEHASGFQDVELGSDELPVQTMLGVKWSVNSDTFFFYVTLDENPATWREILSKVASVFDPLGFLAPLILLGKKVLQEMCQRGIEWDDPLPKELMPQWTSWLNLLKNLHNLQIARCFVPEHLGTIQKIKLHHFSDASSHGYGQCSYIRVLSEDEVHCSFVIGKGCAHQNCDYTQAWLNSCGDLFSSQYHVKGRAGAQNWPRIFLDRFKGSLRLH